MLVHQYYGDATCWRRVQPNLFYLLVTSIVFDMVEEEANIRFVLEVGKYSCLYKQL